MLKHVILQSSCEIDKDCQTVLRQTYGHCNYPDILDLNLGSKKGNYCTVHGKFCKPPPTSSGRIDVNIAGRPTESSTKSSRNFASYYASRTCVNIPCPWSSQLYLLAFRNDVLQWASDLTLDDFVAMMSSECVMSARNLFWMSAPEKELTNAEAKNLEAHRQLKDFSFPDLSQYAKNSRARGELKDGCLMTLTTNCSKIFSEEHGRFMQGKELLTAQTLPATRLQSETCRAPQLALGNVKASSLPKMAGNSMSVPCLGCVLLAAICCIEPIPK